MAINWTGTFPLATFKNPITVTLSEQLSAPPPGDGAYPDWYNDGEGMHTQIPHDLVRWLNNLGSYCQPWPQYMQSSAISSGLTGGDRNGETSLSVTAGAGEYLIFQCPVAVPPGAIKMYFTAGIKKGVAFGAGTITYATVYLSQQPYTATARSGALFDPNGLVTSTTNPVGMRQAVNITTASSYTLISDVVTNCADACYQDPAGNGSIMTSNLIFTLTCASPSSLIMGVKDFTCWFAWE